MDLGLTDKVYVVSAASAGLGRATAEALVGEGARIVPVARREAKLAEFAKAHGGAVSPLVADLAEPGTPEAAVERAVNTYGRIDGAFVSVGGPPRGAVLDNSDEEWLQSFSSVFLPAIRMARAVTARSPKVVLGFVLSTSVKAPLATMAISNGLRPGLGMLVKQLGDELGPQGGRTFGLMPGSIDTERLQSLRSGTDDPEAARKAAAEAIPLRRLGEPAEFGRVAAFLMSPAASYVNGCCIPVDGGIMRAL